MPYTSYEDRPTEIAGWENSLPQLARAVTHLRLDMVAEFHEHAAYEYAEQAKQAEASGDVEGAEHLKRMAIQEKAILLACLEFSAYCDRHESG